MRTDTLGLGEGWRGLVLGRLGSHSGPAVAALFLRALAGVSLIAWASLAVQAELLIGEGGILPAASLFERLRGRVDFWELPSWMWWAHDDGAIVSGLAAGLLLSALALFGVLPRLTLGLAGFLYLGFTLAAGSFLSFQWDNLLIECCALAMLLPRDRAAPLAHGLLRLLLFKLYFESGVAKAQSHLGDWLDGSAMVSYYETAPLPAPLAWYAHQLPAGWHHLESWWTLFFEGVLPFAIFGPRRARLVVFGVFTGFQLLNMATANYGFFCWLALCLHLLLLDEGDLRRWGDALRARLQLRPAAWSERPPQGLWVAPLALLWCLASASGGLERFAELNPTPRLAELGSRWRVANTYHLFGHITTERIEPELQLLVDGEWVAWDLRYKPGDPQRAPPYVAPHQPRLDFRLWFYGLSWQRGLPDYVGGWLLGVCRHADRYSALFERPLPPEPRALRLVYWRYWYAPPGAEAWWQRERVGGSEVLDCGAARRAVEAGSGP